MIKRFLHDDNGATAIEYALIASMIAVVIAAVLVLLGGNLRGAFQTVSDAFPA